jgi:hypothetical protein
MYSPALRTVIADARIQDLRRARAKSIRPHRSSEDSNPPSHARWGLLSLPRMRRLAFANPSRAN